MNARPREEDAQEAGDGRLAAFEELRRLARGAAEKLAAGDWSGFSELITRKSRVIAGLKEEAGTRGAMGERAERALRALLEEEARTLSLLTGLRDEVERSLGDVARGDAGLRSYRAGSGARVLDRHV